MIIFADGPVPPDQMKRFFGLILAVNHYVTTADCVGDGTAWEEGGMLCLVIAVNRGLPQDQRDFETLRSRMGELQGQGNWRLRFAERGMPFDFWMLEVACSDADRLIDQLVAAPGPLGWGSPKPLVDKLLAKLIKAA